MSDPLNSSQRTSLLITLLNFEKILRRVETLLDSAEANGILFRPRLNISKEKRAQAHQKISAALDQIYELSRLFALDTEEQDAARLIRSEMSVHWANLLDSRSGKLKRYGKVHPQLAENLDAYILSLSNIAISLATLFKENSS
jgi:hypothetical protein